MIQDWALSRLALADLRDVRVTVSRPPGGRINLQREALAMRECAGMSLEDCADLPNGTRSHPEAIQTLTLDDQCC